MSIKKGQTIQLTIDSTAFKGKGIGKLDGRAVFVPGTAPGDYIEARVVKKKKSYLEAKLTRLLEPSPNRITPRCSHASVCGGCTWQHLPYPVQLKNKEQHVRDHIERIAHLDPSITHPIIPCENPFYYRNKMEYSFSTRRWLTEDEIKSDEYVDDTGFAAGLHAPGRFDKILNLNECHLQAPISYEILDFVRNYCIKKGIPAFDNKNNRGYLRHLMIRNSHYSDDLMVNLVTFEDNEEQIRKLADSLIKQFPSITTIINNVNDQPNPTAVGRFENILYGPGTITDQIGKHQFQIDVNAFFQTNTSQAEKLYEVAKSFADLNDSELLYDLYCGVGTLSLYLAENAKKVVGIELVDVAIQNARYNAKFNGVDNVEFVLGDMKDTLNKEFLEKHGVPNCIVTDPPRSGMHPDVVRQLSDLKVSKLVYVSCNPSTMARDLQILKEFYSVDKVQPVDMFPQTYHIEAVARLTNKEHP